MEYYNAKKIAELTGYGDKKAYKIIQSLNEDLKKEYPNQIILSAKIPIWYWEKRTKGEIQNEMQKIKVEAVS